MLLTIVSQTHAQLRLFGYKCARFSWPGGPPKKGHGYTCLMPQSQFVECVAVRRAHIARAALVCHFLQSYRSLPWLCLLVSRDAASCGRGVQLPRATCATSSRQGSSLAVLTCGTQGRPGSRLCTRPFLPTSRFRDPHPCAHPTLRASPQLREHLSLT